MKLVALILLTSSALAAPVDFVREVRPILQKHCYSCHGEKKQKSGLRLDIKAAAFQGGDKHSPDIISGKASDSPLIHFITTDDDDELMPPKGKLSAANIATLTTWINEGAPWPDGVDLAKLEDRRDHWSFKPLSVPSLKSQVSSSPQSSASGQLETLNLKLETSQLDKFIDAKLAEQNLHRSPPADPISLIRRITFDLTGLPPTPDETTAFEKEFIQNRASSIQHLVDRLLKSERYGERWAQHWLDVVRYADTHGFEVNTERPNAWPYRDYVIRAFNNDTPYDRFIKEQIVGDAMGQDAATGFLVTASVLLPGQIGKDDASKRLARQDSIDEMVMNIGQTFLGLSIGCARCHDHKFDPITAKDYYAMQAFVAGVEYADRDLHTPAAEAARAEEKQLKARLAQIDKELSTFVPLAKSGAERPMINARENSDRFPPVKTQRLRFTIKATTNLEPCIDELEVFNTRGENVALTTTGTKRKSSGDIGVAERHELRFLTDGRYGNSRSWLSNKLGQGWVELDFPQEQQIERVVWSRDRDGKFTDRLATDYQIEIGDAAGQWHTVADASDRQKFDPKNKKLAKPTLKGLTPAENKHARPLFEEKSRTEKQIAQAVNLQKAFAGTFRTPDDIHLLSRGDPEQPKEPVTPAVLSSLGNVTLPKESAEQDRRRVLADWIATAQNPLTARVMVNRIWQGHFGTGLVQTPSDFGRMGTNPTHPELLDWLAAEFIRSGWSVKHMHRLIMLSETYGQSSQTEEDNQTMRQSETEKSGPSEVSPSPHLIVSLSPNAAATIDADVHYLWRFPSRRIEAESIRDSILAVSGRLNLKMYGRGYNLFDQRGGLSGFDPIETFNSENQRRMIYAHKVRREPETVFGAFDCPDAGQSTARRIESTTPIQALNLFNSLFTLEQSEAFATRVQQEAGTDPAKQITLAYQLSFSRPPTAAELTDITPLVQNHGLSALCRALFNSNEFLFVP
ncbi:MAG: PSD1 and planctomycete cytochrome C domain-containing protein [Prosthecobacter sp.]|uniref:PSD1 and planctomycete cytochrome C domain-containing protein n=1 Tax=Prosthecobacter sp. TaxID=1965333 RepID=UPI0025FB0EFE|nr:PSD1 and planctomycete cytochrome C domain-containing protein [Prosthecobacter sp.]MCF7788148.1 PSD1 and planctomycete cytochrome C domain-containing protein [Prosthecobacter sp.]